MTKRNTIVIIIVCFMLLGSLVTLLFAFNYRCSICELIENILLDILTGAIVAIPTGLIGMFYFESKENIKTDMCVQSIANQVFSFNKAKAYDLEYILKFKDELMKEVDTLNNSLSSRFVRKRKLLVQLEDCCVQLNRQLSEAIHIQKEHFSIKYKKEEPLASIHKCRRICKQMGYDYSSDFEE